VWDEDHAIVSAAVMALLPGSIFVERSFLPDPAMVSLATTSVWMLVAYCQTERLRYLILAGLIGAWSFLTKIPGLIVGIPMLYAMLTILSPKRILHSKKLATISVAAILTLLPVIAYYLWARHLALTYPPHHFAGSSFWIWDSGIQSWWQQKYFLPQLYWHLNIWMWTKPIIALVLIGLFLRPPQGEQKFGADQLSVEGFDKAPWLFHWWMLAGVIYYLIGAKELVSNPWNLHFINPVAAALAGHAIIAIASFINRIARKPASLAFIAFILLIIGGFRQKNLQYVYGSYVNESYKLGLALREVSQPQDLVITVAHTIGDPVVIYYSRRRGWVFPPAQPEKGWGELPKDDKESIRLFDELRVKKATWLGLVNERSDEIRKKHPDLAKHIERTCELKKESPEWVIYRILTPEEVSKLPA
jgi:4-amino-4-deoxy-L-arabinose transferase-like glycosyltransferase